MNKLCIVLLAVCFVSVQALVKRDAPAEENSFEKIQKKLVELGQQFNASITEALNSEQVKKQLSDVASALSPENVQKQIAEGLQKLQQAADAFKPKEDPPK